VTLFAELLAAGVPTASHESDLYFPATPATRAILARHPVAKSVASGFVNQVEGGVWIDVPFAYDPWWHNRVCRTVCRC
jgi:hypothetical protein